MNIWGTFPEWIQAVCAILALGGLVWYCLETKSIREASIAQSEASRHPFPMLAGIANMGKVLSIVNAGEGIALNVRWRFCNEIDDDLRGLGSITVNDQRQLTVSGIKASFSYFKSGNGIRVIYTDTAFKQYWTEIHYVSDYDAEAEYFVRTETGSL